MGNIVKIIFSILLCFLAIAGAVMGVYHIIQSVGSLV